MENSPKVTILAAMATPHQKINIFLQNKVKFGQIKVHAKFQPAFGGGLKSFSCHTQVCYSLYSPLYVEDE